MGDGNTIDTSDSDIQQALESLTDTFGSQTVQNSQSQINDLMTKFKEALDETED